MSQFQSSKPRELDSSRSLRFFFGFVLLLNASSIWSHASKEAVESRAVILDFVGLCASLMPPPRLLMILLNAYHTHDYSACALQTATFIPRLSHHIPPNPPHYYCVRNLSLQRSLSRYPGHSLAKLVPDDVIIQLQAVLPTPRLCSRPRSPRMAPLATTEKRPAYLQCLQLTPSPITQ